MINDNRQNKILEKVSSVIDERVKAAGAVNLEDVKALIAESAASNESFRYQEIPPVTANSPGIKGSISWDSDYVYLCIAADTWTRIALTAWE